MARSDELAVLWSDEDFVAVTKPAGLASIPGRAEADSALERVGRQLHLPASGTQDPRLRIVHRLDKDTSGVLVFATNSAGQRHLSHQFQNNQVRKEYLALVAGRPTQPRGQIDAPIAHHPTRPRYMAVVTHGGRPALTVWQVEELFRDFALLRVFPQTGKTHQIRVHLQHVGMPLAIDPLYHPLVPNVRAGIYLSDLKPGYRLAPGQAEHPLIDRLTLHAQRLCFLDRRGNPVVLEAPLPRDFRAAIAQLRRLDR